MGEKLQDKEKEELKMKCLYCGGEARKGKSSYTADRDHFHLFIRDIPAYVCTQCGEKFFDEEEVRRIQRLIKQVEAEIDNMRAYELV